MFKLRKTKRTPEVTFTTAETPKVHPKLVALLEYLAGNSSEAPYDAEGCQIDGGLVVAHRHGCECGAWTKYGENWFEVFSLHGSDEGLKALRESRHWVKTPPSPATIANQKRREQERLKAAEDAERRERELAERAEAHRAMMARMKAEAEAEYRAHAPNG